jgi:hypothetical protein
MKPPEPQNYVPEPANDPADSDALRDQIKDRTTEHAIPPRLEDEGQAGG